MNPRRHVRVDQGFFDDLDAQLGADRGPNGEPSATDFLVMDLPTIVDRFAEDFESLALAYPDRSDYRVLVSTADGQRPASGGRLPLLGLPVRVPCTPRKEHWPPGFGGGLRGALLLL